MISDDFYGKKPFIWWAGIVENRDDPLQLGSIQVRIIGLHPIEESEKASVPTEKLPWAQILLPTTGAKTTSGPREGDWVFGFFQDGEYAQVPVVIGVFPGVESQQSQTVYKEAIVRKVYGTQSSNVASNVNIINILSGGNLDLAAKVVPRVPKGRTERSVGAPTVPALARGTVIGSAIEEVEKFLAHGCDLSFLVNKEIAEIKAKIVAKIVAARAAAEAALRSSSSSPLVTQIKEVIATLKTYWAIIKDYIKIITDVIKLAMELLDFTIKVIKWAMTLPAKLMALVKRCVTSVLSPIGEAVDDVFAELGRGINLSAATGFGAAFLSQLSSVTSQVKSVGSSSLGSSINLSSNPTFSNTITISSNTAIDSESLLTTIDSITNSLVIDDEELEKAAGKPFDIAEYGSV